MYEIQEKPDVFGVLDNGAMFKPLVTLKDESGGVSHIIEDDHCYVLVNKCHEKPTRFAMVRHWYGEAVEALKDLPIPKGA